MAEATVADGTTATQDATATDAAQGTQQEEFVFDKWLTAQDDKVRGGFEDHVRSLKATLETERANREALDKKIRLLSKDAAAGSELKAELDKLSGELSNASAKADFFRDAHDAKIVDLELAWYAAQKDGLVDERTGKVDMKALRETRPALFVVAKTVVPPGNQGNGVGQEGAKQASMNNFIRAGTGRSIR